MWLSGATRDPRPSDPGLGALPRLNLELREQLRAPERRDYAAAAAMIAGLGPEGQPARDRPLAVAGRTIMKLRVNFVWHRS
jgi:hypothetical protein